MMPSLDGAAWFEIEIWYVHHLLKQRGLVQTPTFQACFWSPRAAESIWPEMISGQLFSHTFHLDLGFPSAWSGCPYCLPHFEMSLILLSCHLRPDSFAGKNQGSASQCGLLGYARCIPKPVLAGRCALLSGFRSAICALIRMANARDTFCQ